MRTTSCLLLLIALLLTAIARTATAADEASDFIAKGERLFDQANEITLTAPDDARRLYAQSALCFERVIDAGTRNAALYYNAGNARYQAGDIGRAILNYRRGEYLAPGDADLAHNLEFVRKQREDSIPESHKSRALRTVLFWHYDIATPVRVVVFALAYLALWIAAIALLYRRLTELRWTVIVAFLLAALMGGSIVLDATQARRDRAGVVLADEVTARQGDDTAYRPAFSTPLHAGAEFRLVEARDEWLRVELSDGRRCWIPAHAVELI